jgi:hypothetical protein
MMALHGVQYMNNKWHSCNVRTSLMWTYPMPQVRATWLRGRMCAWLWTVSPAYSLYVYVSWLGGTYNYCVPVICICMCFVLNMHSVCHEYKHMLLCMYTHVCTNMSFKASSTSSYCKYMLHPFSASLYLEMSLNSIAVIPHFTNVALEFFVLFCHRSVFLLSCGTIWAVMFIFTYYAWSCSHSLLSAKHWDLSLPHIYLRCRIAVSTVSKYVCMYTLNVSNIVNAHLMTFRIALFCWLVTCMHGTQYNVTSFESHFLDTDAVAVAVALGTYNRSRGRSLGHIQP